MNTIKLLNGETASRDYLKEQARGDDFYYNYLGKTCFSSTIIKTLIDSPKKFYYYRKYGSEEETASLGLGRMIHAKALTPEIFDKDYLVVDVKTKAAKKFKDAKADNPDKYCLTITEEEKMNRVVDALLKNDAFMVRLQGSQPEEPAIGEIYGYPFRAKADILKRPFLYDLKTTADIKALPYSAKKYGYDVQAFIYCTLFNIEPQDFEFVAVDKASLDIAIYTIDQEFIRTGREKVQYALSLYEEYFLGKTDEEQQDSVNQYYIKGTLTG